MVEVNLNCESDVIPDKYVIENIFDIKYENQVQNDAQNFSKGIKQYLERKL